MWDTNRVRLLAVLVALAACSAPERARPVTRVDMPAPLQASAKVPAAPGLRLPDGVTPLRYDLTLELDPDKDTFDGEVHVRVRLDRATDHIWIHADELEIKSARYDEGPLTALPVVGDEMLAFGFGKTLAPREIELVFAYTGHTTGDQEGLFRQQRANRWYLFSDPVAAPVYVYGYLNGAEGPQVTTGPVQGADGVEVSVIFDFGVGAIDWRGAWFNPGT